MSFILVVGDAYVGTGTAHFHLIATAFGWSVSVRGFASVEDIQALRDQGCTLAEIAQKTRTTVAIVRRIVGRVDRVGRRQKHEEVADRLNREPISWTEKVARWKAETGLCGVTFWRVLKGLSDRHPPTHRQED